MAGGIRSGSGRLRLHAATDRLPGCNCSCAAPEDRRNRRDYSEEERAAGFGAWSAGCHREPAGRKLTPLLLNSPVCQAAGSPGRPKQAHVGSAMCDSGCSRPHRSTARCRPLVPLHRQVFARLRRCTGRRWGWQGVVCLLQINCRRFRPGIQPGVASIKRRFVGECAEHNRLRRHNNRPPRPRQALDRTAAT